MFAESIKSGLCHVESCLESYQFHTEHIKSYLCHTEPIKHLSKPIYQSFIGIVSSIAAFLAYQASSMPHNAKQYHTTPQ